MVSLLQTNVFKDLSLLVENYVINLKSRPDRLEVFKQKNLKNFNRIKIFEAYDGKEVSRTALVEGNFILEENTYQETALAVALSHVHLWKMCVETNQIITVIEDDVVLEDNFFKIQENLIRINSDFDIMLFGFNADWPLEVSFGNGLPKSTILFEAQPEEFFKTKTYSTPKLEAFAGCCCYAITPRGAKIFLETILPLGGGYYPLRVFKAPYGGDFTKAEWRNSGVDVAMSMCLQNMIAKVCLPPIAIPANNWADSSFERKGHSVY